MKKRGQAAMEFLMTYGWAILIILIVIAALYYLGLFDSDTQASAQFGTGPFSAQDIRVTENGVRLTVKAMGISAASVTNMIADGTTCISTLEDISQAAQSSYDIVCPAPLTKGKKISGTIQLSYTPLTGVSHNIDGTFSGVVEKSNPSTTPLSGNDITSMSYTGTTTPTAIIRIGSATSSEVLGTLILPAGSYTDGDEVLKTLKINIASPYTSSPTNSVLITLNNRNIKVFLPSTAAAQDYFIADDGSTYITSIAPANLKQAAP